MARRYARNKAEAAALGVPTYYEARRSKAAAARRGLPQSVLRGHARGDKGEASLTELRQVVAGIFGAGLRPMVIYSGGQKVYVTPTTKAQASKIGRYHNAVKQSASGDDTALRRFRGWAVGGYEVDADPDDLSWIFVSGQLAIESIYPETVA